MPHINLPENLFGIRSLATYRPETGKPLYDLAEALLRNSSLNQVDAEIIATFISAKNECAFCTNSHAAAAKYLLDTKNELVDLVIKNYETAPISDKMKTLLTIAKCVQKDARTVTKEMIKTARLTGVSDAEIHDTVLIAASFCMFNRYVDGLATIIPEKISDFEPMGKQMATLGYIPPKCN